MTTQATGTAAGSQRFPREDSDFATYGHTSEIAVTPARGGEEAAEMPSPDPSGTAAQTS